QSDCNPSFSARPDGSQGPAEELKQQASDTVGSPWKVAFSSFLFFSSGAIIPVIPFICGLTGIPALIGALALVAIALFMTGGIGGWLTCACPFKRAMRQLCIGLCGAAVSYGLRLIFYI